MPQVRTAKFIRQPEKFAHRQITDRSLDIIEHLARYRFLPRSLLIRLVAGDERTTDEHLQWMWHRGLINRFAFPRIGNPGEFNYYLDTAEPLNLLESHRPQFRLDDQYREDVRNNRERDYAGAVERQEHGRLLFLQHELMINRFHALLELAARSSSGRVQLATFVQGAPLHSSVSVPVMRFEQDRPGHGFWREKVGVVETLPHRPDAFFTLRFLDRPEEKQLEHFLYEADRSTMKAADMKRKLRAHFYFSVNNKREYLQQIYGIDHVRAVLVETLDEARFESLRAAARSAAVSKRPSGLFWFTATEFLAGPDDAGNEPLYMRRPDVVLKPIWLSPVDETLHSLTDP